MAANLTPQYYEAEERYKAASTPEEKLVALKDMLSNIPKHKGTEKLQADIKKKISSFKKESQKKKSKNTFNPFYVEKQGAGQVVLVGFPNVGKSSLVGTLTRAKTKIADYPFSTNLPIAGMMPYDDVLIQLVDTPPITEDNVPPGIIGTYRTADAILIMVDSQAEEGLEQLEGCLSLLIGKNIITPPGQKMKEGTLPYHILANKADMSGSSDILEIIKELNPDVNLIPISSLEEEQGMLREKIFSMLNIIRVYSKTPGKAPDMEKPFTLKQGSTVLDFAFAVHRDFPNKLKNALVWGSARFDGQAVPKDYVLEDKDIVELQV